MSKNCVINEENVTGSCNKKVAIVTGAAGGIGYGIAKVLADKGYIVCALGRSESIHKLSETFGDDSNIERVVDTFLCDITNRGLIDEVVASIVEKYGRVDVLVNNAGVAKIRSFEETTEEYLDMHIDINIKGTWNMTQAVIKHMKKEMWGRIINISSVTGPFVCDKGYSAYALSKAALIGLTKALAVEYAEFGITCNAICPGFILTPNVRRSAATTNPDNPEKVLNKMAEKVPVGKLGTVEQVGNLVAFLASDEADYITGTSNIIDGGNMIPETGVMGL